MRLKKYAEALTLYASLVKQFPQIGGEYGSAAALAGDIESADRIWEKFRSLQPDNAGVLLRLGSEYQNIGLYAKARALFSKAANIEPRNLEAQLERAWLLAQINSVDDARGAVNKCLELDSRNEEALFLSAHLDHRENKLEAAERQFRAMIASGPGQLRLNYSYHCELAQILDRTGRFEEAMAVLAEGKRLAPQVVNLEVIGEWLENKLRVTKALPKNILDTWGGAFPPPARASVPPLALLTGSARSGTTLLERVLDAHPAVVACDESVAFSKILSSINVAAPSISAQRLNFLRERYLTILTKELGRPGPGKMLLDKNPSQLVWLPEALRVFPELRVLIALRDPRDVMISLYFQDHRRTNYLTFEQLARLYGHEMDMWLAVREWEGLAWMETRYEDIVADLQKEGSRVTTFLGFDWYENQARFYEKNREKPVMSTNYNDVSKPVYTRSVGRWRVYEKYLAPILPALEPYCRRFGYA